MKRYVCPVCDQVMESTHYCKTCRRIVWHPTVRNATYFLNERHPSREADCSYHNDLHAEDAGRRAGLGSSGQSTRTKERTKERTREWTKRKPKFTALIVLAAVIGILDWLPNLARSGFEGITDLGGGIPEYAAAPEWIVEGEETEIILGEGELTDEEVRAQGIACNAYPHFPAVEEEITELLWEQMNLAGLEMRDQETWSYNYDSETYSSYETTDEWSLYRNGEYIGFLTILSDTATGELHGLQCCTQTEGDARAVGTDFLEILDQAGAVLDLEEARLGFEEALGTTDSDDYVSTEKGGLHIMYSTLGSESVLYSVAIYAGEEY